MVRHVFRADRRIFKWEIFYTARHPGRYHHLHGDIGGWKLWIGTNRGVFSYDGKSLQNYSTSKAFWIILSIRSRNFAGHGMGGCYRWSFNLWWEELEKHQSDQGRVRSNIVEAPDKTIWLTSPSSLTHYDGQIWRTYRWRKPRGILPR